LATSEATNGGNIAQSDALNFSIGSIEKDLEARLTDVFKLDMEAISIKSCKEVEKGMEKLRSKELLKLPTMSAVEYEEKVAALPQIGKLPNEAILLQKLVMDVVYTLKIQRWMQIALEKKRIDRIHYDNKQNELKHWYHHINNDLFK